MLIIEDDGLRAMTDDVCTLKCLVCWLMLMLILLLFLPLCVLYTWWLLITLTYCRNKRRIESIL